MRAFRRWLLAKLLEWEEEEFRPLYLFDPRYPALYACVVRKEAVADVSTNFNRARARFLEELAKGNRARLVEFGALRIVEASK